MNRSVSLILAADDLSIFAAPIKRVHGLYRAVHCVCTPAECEAASTRARADNSAVVLGVFGKIGPQAIRLLCEPDHEQLQQQRQVQWIHSFSTGTDGYDFKNLASVIGTIPFSNARGVYADDAVF
jgi:hypothetical protein